MMSTSHFPPNRSTGDDDEQRLDLTATNNKTQATVL
jgi:hypothetical protein